MSRPQTPSLPVEDEEKNYGDNHIVVEATHSPSAFDEKTDRRLTRKMDIFVIPVLGVLYLLSFLDRGNIGNANVASPSMSMSLNLSATQYGAAVSVVYATYVIFEPVWANLAKPVSPKVVLACSAIAWGSITIGTAFAKNYGQLLAIRVLLGIFEAGLFPTVFTYILMNYRHDEVTRRASYIMSCAALSGSFGGLIAYGLIHIENGKMVGWQYLYLVEGLLSLAVAPLAYFWIPDSMEEAWFLTAEEKLAAKARTVSNKAHYDPAEKFSWRQVGLGLTDWKTYLSGAIQFCADITLYGMSTFMPTIIKGMGYSNVNAQLLTVPVYFVAACSFLFFARLSDRQKLRFPFVVLSFTFNIVGYIILATVDNVHGRYGGVFISALGLYVGSGTNTSWLAANVRYHYKRTTSFSTNQLIGNCAGAAIGSIYLSSWGPRYLPSLYISIALSALGLILTLLMAAVLTMINKHREKRCKVDNVPDQPELGDANPHFRYWI